MPIRIEAIKEPEKKERNHDIIRRFIGHEKLSSISQKQFMKINDFLEIIL